MSLMKKKFDLTSMSIDTEGGTSVPVPKLRNGLIANAFRGFGGGSEREVHGFVPLLRDEASFEDLADDEAWLSEDETIACVGLRTDARKVPPDLLKRELNKRVKAWCEERGVEKAPKSIKKEIRELLEDELLRKALPKTKVHQIWIDLANNRVYVDTVIEGKLDLVRKHLRRAGLEVRLASPLVIPGSADMAPSETFYAWLWMTGETNGGYIDLSDHGLHSAMLWVGDKVGLRQEHETKPTTIVTGENPSEQVTARSGLKNGWLVAQIKLDMVSQDQEYSVLLDGPSGRFKQVSAPGPEAEDDWGNVYVRLELLKRFEALVSALVSTFARTPLAEMERQLDAWMGKDSETDAA